MSEWWEGLTEKQRRFCEAYSANGGNAMRAAAEAGYKVPDPEGARALGNARIKAALEKLRAQATGTAIATREERQRFWSETLRSADVSMSDRLRASELLGKSQVDFVTKTEVTGNNGGPIEIKIDLDSMTDEQLAAIESLGTALAE